MTQTRTRQQSWWRVATAGCLLGCAPKLPLHPLQEFFNRNYNSVFHNWHNWYCVSSALQKRSSKIRHHLPNSIRMEFCSLFSSPLQVISQFQIYWDCGLGSIKMEFLAGACKGFHPSYHTALIFPRETRLKRSVKHMRIIWAPELLSPWLPCLLQGSQGASVYMPNPVLKWCWFHHHDPLKCVFGEKEVGDGWLFCCGWRQDPGILKTN